MRYFLIPFVLHIFLQNDIFWQLLYTYWPEVTVIIVAIVLSCFCYYCHEQFFACIKRPCVDPWDTIRKSANARDMRINIARRNFRMADEEMRKIELKEAEKDDPQFRVRITTYFYLS